MFAFETVSICFDVTNTVIFHVRVSSPCVFLLTCGCWCSRELQSETVEVCFISVIVMFHMIWERCVV